MTNSNVTVAVYSTMLRENIALGRKSLSVNFFNGNITNFPVNEICHIKKSSENQLEHRLISLLRMSKKNYIKKLKNKNKYLIDNNILDTKKKILKKIDSLLKIQILDCTLRDGGYYNNWYFVVSLVNKYINTVSNLPIRPVKIRYLSNANDKKRTFYHLDTNILKIFKKKLKIFI